MTLPIVITPPAERDLLDLTQWIDENAGQAIASAYVDRVEARIARLRHYPNRGAARPEFGNGVLALSFERRLLILYRVDQDAVRILRVVSAERDLRDLTL